MKRKEREENLLLEVGAEADFLDGVDAVGELVARLDDLAERTTPDLLDLLKVPR